MEQGKRAAWPLALIAAPAAVASWSGGGGLGGMCGFGPVNLLPGVGGGLTLNTAITLPVGVEAYAAFALGAWLAPGTPDRARRFARWSALGALAYGLAGQVAYHLLRSHGYTAAPAPVVVLVSCMPVAVLGFAAALTHLLRPEDVAGERSQHGVSSRSPATPPGTVPASSFEAAKARMRQAAELGFRYTDNRAAADFGLTRAAVTEARRQVNEDPPAGVSVAQPLIPAGASGQDPGPPNPPGVLAALNGHGGAGG